MASLQIYHSRERALVAAGDVFLAAAAAVSSPFRRRRKPRAPARILLLRLERIGDLLMALPGLAAVRALAPQAHIDLMVGSWNADLARAIPAIDHVETLDARWLARDTSGAPLPSLLKAAVKWRTRRYDLAINFEPDIRSNLLLAASGARWTAGYWSGGGGPLLDEPLDYDTRSHTSDNATRLVSAVFGSPAPEPAGPLLQIPAEERERARALVRSATRPIVAVHVSGGRAVKQWPVNRFAAVARQLAASQGARIVLTGSPADRGLIDDVLEACGPGVAIDASGAGSLLALAALLAEADLLITGDTGPMHLAVAVGTPVVAVFGPSEPRRYAPRGPRDRVVRVDLPCAPCNRIRLPPARCAVGTPDCLAGVSVEAVVRAAGEALAR